LSAHAPDASDTLDRAHAHTLQGEREAALRLAGALLAAHADDLGAAALLTQLLADMGRRQIAAQAARRLVDAHIRRGDLPQALVMARLGAAAGADGEGLVKQIAAAFGNGSSRLADVTPPPLPRRVEIPPFFREASGDALADRAQKALERFLSTPDPMVDDGALPTLPLFSALEPDALETLLGAFRIHQLAAGDRCITQGEEGHAAYVVARGMLQVVRRGDDGIDKTLAALGPGALFGEMALVSEAPRAASVVASEPSTVLEARRELLEAAAQEAPAVGEALGRFCRQRMIANLLRHSPILASVDPDRRASLFARFQTRTFHAGDALVREGEESHGLFLIASGHVQVRSRDADGDQVLIAELGPGEVVGEISLVLRRPTNADVVATHPTVALELTADQFQTSIKEHPTLLRELYEMAVKREEETRNLVAQEALDVEDVVLV
jgi:CRP-like cAMP-binding protein